MLRAAAWGPAAPLDLAPACRIFLPGFPLHQGKHRQDVATYLIPGVASRPGGSSGGLQDTKRTVSGGTIGAAQGWGLARATLTWHSKEQHCGRGGQRGMSGAWAWPRRPPMLRLLVEERALVMPGRGAGGRGGAYHLLHIIFLKSEREKSN